MFLKAYRQIKNHENKVIGFVLQWYDADSNLSSDEKQEKNNEITEIINSFAYAPEGNEEILILAVYDNESLVKAREQQVRELRTSYIGSICDKIQSKLSTAFHQSTNSAVILWTEISATDPCSVAYEWHTAGKFTKKLQAKAYEGEDQANKEILPANTSLSMSAVLSRLNIAKEQDANSLEGSVTPGVYWTYIYYKNIFDDTTKRGWDYSCGIAITYAANGTAKDLKTLVDEYGGKTDPAIKKNNTNYTQATANGVLRKITGYYTELKKAIEALENANQ